jgi:hypothetical protein
MIVLLSYGVHKPYILTSLEFLTFLNYYSIFLTHLLGDLAEKIHDGKNADVACDFYHRYKVECLFLSLSLSLSLYIYIYIIDFFYFV